MVPRRLAWQKADSSLLMEYKTVLQNKLEDLEDPESLQCEDPRCKMQHHTDERDQHVLDVMSAWIEASYTTIPVIPCPRPAVLGKEKRLQLPGWKETCEPLSHGAKFWYSVWLSAGRPATGELHRLMVVTKTKFRASVRKARGEANSSKAHNLLEAAEKGDQALLKEMRKVLGSKHQEQELPNSLEGTVGHSAILEKFQSLYSALYNSAGTEEQMQALKLLMDSKVDFRSEAEVKKVTTEEV